MYFLTALRRSPFGGAGWLASAARRMAMSANVIGTLPSWADSNISPGTRGVRASPWAAPRYSAPHRKAFQVRCRRSEMGSSKRRDQSVIVFAVLIGYGQYTGKKVAPAAPGPVVLGLLLLWSEKHTKATGPS
jgi:hypothetical protein